MQNDLLLTLEILDTLLRGGSVSASRLCGNFGISLATLKRRLDDARHLGAHVESVKLGHQWFYHLANPVAVELRLAQWLALERSRSLV